MKQHALAFFCFLAFAVNGLAGEAPYIESNAIKERFKNISADDMKLLRSKKILFASRSFGLNLRNGLASLSKQDAKYDILGSYQRFDVFKNGGDLSIIPSGIFAEKNFVHFLASYWPHSVRVDEIEKLLTMPPHNFGSQVDFVLIYFHTAVPNIFEHYSSKMDALQARFPNIRFLYVTSGFMGKSKVKDNEQSHEFGEKIRERYKGKVPLYDLAAILSDNFRVGHQYCPEYSKDPADVHPNLQAGQEMMAKGFLLLLKESLEWTPKDSSGGAATPLAKTKENVILPTGSPDYKAVRAILDANKQDKKKVKNVAVVENGRVVELYLQEGGVSHLTHHIGVLSELRLLHLYGDRDLNYPLLSKIDPAIGNCTKLEELLLNSNELSGLPVTINKLTNMKKLSLADNKLKNLPKSVQDWADKHDPKGLSAQK